MSADDINMVYDAVDEIMRHKMSSKHDFIPKVEEKHGGIDFHVSGKSLAEEIATHIIHKQGGTTKTTYKLIGKDKDGKEKFRSTVILRLPLLKVNDHLFYDKEIMRITQITGDGVLIVSYKDELKKIHLNWNTVKDLEPIDSYLILKKAFVTAITSDSVLLMDLENETYEEFELPLSIFPNALEQASTILLGNYKDHWYFLGTIKNTDWWC